MRCLIRSSMLVLFLVFATGASAHIGEKVFLIFEIADADLGDIEFDGNIEDWEDAVGPPSLLPADMFSDPGVGDGAAYDPADMDYRVWLAWNQTGNHLYFAMDRLDNIYVNEYAGGNPGSVWQQDSLEFMVDGDHSGGSYNRNNEDLTAEEKTRHFNAQAQKYNFTFDDPEERYGGYPGPADWANRVPFLSAFGQSVGSDPTRRSWSFTLRLSTISSRTKATAGFRRCFRARSSVCRSRWLTATPQGNTGPIRPFQVSRGPFASPSASSMPA